MGNVRVGWAVRAAFLVLSGCLALSGCGKRTVPHSTNPPGGLGGTQGLGGSGPGTGGAGTTTAGTSGAVGTGGSGETGGAGGAVGTGGDAGTGGVLGTGGTVGTGGTSGDAGTGGVVGSGGAIATGGRGGTMGSGGTGPIVPPPSCAGFTGTECQGGDCCESAFVPGGTATVRDALGENWTTSRGARIDKYEVTVARFRNFMNAVKAWEAAGNPVEGAGAHPEVPGSGWKRAWDVDDFFADGLTPTWVGYPWSNPRSCSVCCGCPDYVVPGADGLAVNWVPWHVAFAFCIWDGGRLPAVAEWLAATQGGDAHTTYPWGNSPTAQEMFPTRPEPSAPFPYDDSFWRYIGIPVGSHPASAGRFGHQDLAAGMLEWLRDTVPRSGQPALGGLIELGDDLTMTDFTRRVGAASWELLYGRGGALSTMRGYGSGTVGFRCARDP